MVKPTAMHDIGSALAGKEGPLVQKKLNEIIQTELFKLEQAKRRGLDKAAFAANEESKRAWDCAALIIKSITLYHNAG